MLGELFILHGISKTRRAVQEQTRVLTGEEESWDNFLVIVLGIPLLFLVVIPLATPFLWYSHSKERSGRASEGVFSALMVVLWAAAFGTFSALVSWPWWVGSWAWLVFTGLWWARARRIMAVQS